MAINKGKFFLPTPDVATGAWGAFVTAISAINDGFAYICQAPVTDTIDLIQFWTGTNTVVGNVDVRIETVDGTTGNPSGTLKTVGGNVTVALDGTTSKQYTATFGTPVSVTKGDIIAFVFRNPGASPPTFQLRSSGEIIAKEFPYADRQISGVWTKSASDLALAIHTTSNGYVELNSGHPIAAGSAPSSSVAFGSGSSPNRWANRFVAPANLSVSGCWMLATPSTTSDFIVELYDANNNVLASYTHDATDLQGGNAIFFFEFTTTVLITQGQIYRISVRATTANTMTIDYIPYANALYLGSAAQNGNFYKSTSPNGSTWTDDNTMLAFIGIICDGINPTPVGGLRAIGQGQNRASTY